MSGRTRSSAKAFAVVMLVAVCCLAAILLWHTGERSGALVDQRQVDVPLPAREDRVDQPVRTTRPVVADGAAPVRNTNAAGRVADRAAPAPDAIADEEVLLFYDDAHLRAFLRVAEAEGLTVMGRMGTLHAVRIRVRDAAQLRRVLARAPTPVARGPNFFVRRPDPPTPPEGVTYRAFGGTASDWLGIATTDEQWGRGVKIAVLDTRIVAEATQGDLETLDLLNESADDVAPGHGTAVTSIITGGDQVSGVAPGAAILAVRVMSDSGVGNTFALAQGVLDAVDRGARVINMSVGSQGDSPVLARAITYAREQGAVIVAAAGNDGRDSILYPARYPGVLAVGAVDAAGKPMYFSNRGEALDLVAPGYGVSAVGTEGEPVAFSGTSAATPFVAGAIAGVWSEAPELTGAQVADLLVAYADDAGAPGHDPQYGAGVLDVGRVLERNTPGVVDMVMVHPYIARHATYPDELVVSLYGQNRGTEPLDRVVFRANVDGVPVERTFYDVGVGEIVVHDLRLTRAGVGEREVMIEQEVDVVGAADRSPANNRIITTLSVQ